MPDDLPDVVEDLAAEVTAGATTDYDRVIALQNWFHSSTTAPRSSPVTASNAIENFLQIRNGYCEQFAGTFAAMARTLGIPSRVAVGYTPGRLRDDGWYSVLGKNSHAWPEIWFDGVGWVAVRADALAGHPGRRDYTGVAAEQDTSPAEPTGGGPEAAQPLAGTADHGVRPAVDRRPADRLPRIRMPARPVPCPERHRRRPSPRAARRCRGCCWWSQS